MGGSELTERGSPSHEGEKSKEPICLTKIFEEFCPLYMEMGMSLDEYWNGDVNLVKYYRKKNELERKKKNQEMWMQGLYIQYAISASLNGKKVQYPSEPLALSEAEAVEQRMAKFKNKISEINRNIKKQGGHK